MNPLVDNALLAQEDQRFEAEYRLNFIQGETKPRSIGRPFFLYSPCAAAGILLVHGLMAAPEEVRQWAEFLHSKGYCVYAPRLAGHGTSAKDLSGRRYTDWLDSVNTGIAILKTCCKNVSIGGFSTGGGLALYTAIHQPDVFDAVISVSAPLHFKGMGHHFVNAIHAWNHLVCRLEMPHLARMYARNYPDNPYINYHRCPISGIVEVKKLMSAVYQELPQLRIPALILQGKNDPKVDSRSGKRIFHRIPHPLAQYQEIDFHLHGVVRGAVAQKVFDAVETFLNTIYPSSHKPLD